MNRLFIIAITALFLVAGCSQKDTDQAKEYTLNDLIADLQKQPQGDQIQVKSNPSRMEKFNAPIESMDLELGIEFCSIGRYPAQENPRDKNPDLGTATFLGPFIITETSDTRITMMVKKALASRGIHE